MWKHSLKLLSGFGAAAASSVIVASAAKAPNKPSVADAPAPPAISAPVVDAAAANHAAKPVAAVATGAATVPPAMSYAEPDPADFELVQLQVVMRHGARSTCSLLDFENPEQFARDWTKCHDSDQAIDDPELRPCAPGQLTVNGERMCVELGERLRARYATQLGFLPSAFDERYMHVESTKYPRARLSLKRTLEGLFPGGAPPQAHLDDQVDPDNALNMRLEGCHTLLRDYRRAHADAVAEVEDSALFQVLYNDLSLHYCYA